MPSRVLNPGNEYNETVSLNIGLGQLFYNQVRRSPEAAAVVEGGETITYSQLHAQASHLARQLSQLAVGDQEPVGIVVQHGTSDAVAQLAILYAGGSCVPLDPALPDQQLNGRLTRLHVRCVLTDEANQHRHLPFHIVGISQCPVTADGEEKYGSVFPMPTSLNYCTHLIHTSGTTTEPKAVQVAARSILHVVFHAPFEPIHSTDVVAHVNNSSFDVALFDIWAPLLRGACSVVLSKPVLMDPPTMAGEIDRLGITVMATTTALLNLAAFTYPVAFEKLRICFIGGEAANVAAINNILAAAPPKMLVNAYGPTECCIFCLAHRVTSQDVQDDSVSIGMPIGHNIAYIADDAGHPSDEGELWIGGPGVSLGYANEPGKTAAAFITSAGPKAVSPAQDPPVFYRTGDIVRRRPDGQMEYVGRRDHQVKIRGFRVELGAVEAALLRTGLFAEATALKVDMPENGAGSVLVAYAVPGKVSERPATDEAVALVRAVLPDYMVPQIEIISQMPLNGHAKVDRRQLAELFSQRWKKRNEPILANPTKDVCSVLAQLWTTILATPVAAYDSDADFIRLGGTSLQASLLISQIRRTFGARVSLLTLYDNSTLVVLASVIAGCLDGRSETVHDERHLWLADTNIADDLPCPPGPVVDWRRDTEGRVFLTGATGFVGAFMLADLLRMPGVFQVACLVRVADSTTSGFERIRSGMARYGLWEHEFARRLLAIPGALEDDHLGMGPERFDELGRWASVVFHLGARVNYTQPYSLHRPANTLGTRNVVRFACTGRTKAVHCVSSISCFGPTGYITGATTVREDEPLLPHLAALPYDHGYAQSQWVAEQLMRRLMDRGFPIAVYRPGFITGHSKTGACNPDDFMGRLIRACCEMQCYPQLPNQRKEFVPVDYVSPAILHIAASPASLGCAYHIVPPCRQASLDMDDSMDLVSQAANVPMRAVPYSEWTEWLTTLSPQSLLPLQPMLTETVLDGRTRWELYENMPIYKTTNTDKALADYPGGLDLPVFGLLQMNKYLGFLKATKK